MRSRGGGRPLLLRGRRRVRQTAVVPGSVVHLRRAQAVGALELADQAVRLVDDRVEHGMGHRRSIRRPFPGGKGPNPLSDRQTYRTRAVFRDPRARARH